MEKLQAALQKARGERNNARSKSAIEEVVPAEPRSLGGGTVDQNWEALEMITLDKQRLVDNRIMTFSSTPEAMPFDMLRTKVALMMRQNNWTRLAITSPEQSSGKTTLACNLALGFSRQQDIRTILLDFDMRRPSVAAALGQKADTRIRTFLSGEALPEEHMKRVNDSLAIAMFKDSVSDPMQLVMSPRTPEVLDRLEQDFEPNFMIFDLAPMLPVDETRAILKYVDCTIIVVRAEQTRMNMLDLCEQEVAEHSNVLGVVLNSCRYGTEQNQYYGTGTY